MGTSHIVEVINDGKLVIRQYGQTDGIAEIAGSYICNFLKEHDAEYIKDLLNNTELKDISREEAYDYEKIPEMARYLNGLKMLGGFYGSGIDVHLGSIPAMIQKFGLEDTAKFYIISSDTGYKILNVINVLDCVKEIRDGEFKIPIYLEDKDTESSRKIIINLDDSTITFEYFNQKRTYSFDPFNYRMPTLKDLMRL